MSLSSQSSLKLAILVVSCDNYCDMWEPFFMNFWRFWPNCEYKIYLLSNYYKTNQKRVIPILVGDDHSWSSNLLKGLDEIEEEYVFMIIDDIFFSDFVPQENLKKVFAWIYKIKPNYLRLNPRPKPDKPYSNQFGIVSTGSLYRTATVLSIWKKTVLLDLLKSGESAWDFEIYGSIRSDKYDNFYSTWQVLIPFKNCVIKGKWQRSTFKYFESHGISIHLNRRKVMTLRETLVHYVFVFRNRVLEWFPYLLRRRIKDIFSHGRSKYSLKD